MKPIHWVVVAWGLGWLGFFQMLAPQPLGLLLAISATAWGLILWGTGKITVTIFGDIRKEPDSGFLLWLGMGLGLLAPFIIEHFLGK